MMLDEASQQLEASQAVFENVRTRDKEDEERIEAENAVASATKYYAWAVRSQSRGSIGAMLELASADASIAISHDQLDADPYVLNCANGTLNLRTGDLEAHRRDALLTMSSPVAYDPDARAPTWEKFVSRAMGDDAQMIAYLQRVVGYLITGSTKEHALFFFYGGGANGKSTFTNTLLSLLGTDLAAPSPRDMLFAGKNEHATREAMLYRKRFVLCSEIGEGKRLDEAHVKDITGGDRIAARRMREDFWTFEPTHKIVVSGNHKPIITGTDDGIWRRLRFVPWLVTIPAEERDKDLTQKLAAELPGILTWAVNGCLEWQRVGLADPQTVTKATSDFRAASDALTEFFDLLELAPADPQWITSGAASSFRVTKQRLRKTYEAWCEAEGHMPLGARRFVERVRQHATDNGVTLYERMAQTYEAPHPVRAWFGVRIKGE